MRPSGYLLVILAACSSPSDPSTFKPISVLDGRGEVTDSVRREVEALSPKLDTDGDGIVDVDELLGWTIRVDTTGRPQGIETRVVTSDPKKKDTDEDGLPDGLERLSGADPNRADTDGDGLNDVDEVQRWGTSPASVDTDGDARGPTPDPSAAPDANLFDAAELKLVDDPDHPGTKTSAVDATSPVLADTDGDGQTDFEERANAARSVVIAEMPRVQLRPTANTTLGLFLTLTKTDGSGQKKDVSSSQAIGQGGTFSTSTSTSLALATWASTSSSAGVVVNLSDTAASAGVALSEEDMFGTSIDTTTTLGMGAESRTRFVTTENETRGDLESRTFSVSGGRVVVAVDVVNAGDVAFKMTNLAVAASYFDTARGRRRTLGTLRPVSEPQGGFVLAKGEKVTVQLESRDVETENMLALMRDPSTLSLAPASYEIVNAGATEYRFLQGRVRERAVLLTIDRGDQPSQSWAIATNVRRDPAGFEAGLSVAELLTYVKVPFGKEPLAEADQTVLQKYIFEIAGRRTELYEGPPPDLGDPFPIPASVVSSARRTKASWYAVFQRRNGVTQFYEDPFAAHALPGDRITLTYARDADRDGLSEVEELQLGTKDDSTDTDGDGLSDLFEARVGWTVAVAGAAPRRVWSSPTMADADADGLNDRLEMAGGALGADGFALGTDPRKADTDGDSYGDAEEWGDPADAKDPLRFDDLTPPGVTCQTNAATAFRLKQVRTTTYSATDTNVPLASVSVRFEDGHVEAFRKGAPALQLAGQILRHAVGASAWATDIHGVSTSPVTCTR